MLITQHGWFTSIPFIHDINTIASNRENCSFRLNHHGEFSEAPRKQSYLFLHFPYQCLLKRLTGLNSASQHVPAVWIGYPMRATFSEQEPLPAPENRACAIAVLH